MPDIGDDGAAFQAKLEQAKTTPVLGQVALVWQLGREPESELLLNTTRTQGKKLLDDRGVDITERDNWAIAYVDAQREVCTQGDPNLMDIARGLIKVD